MPRSARLDIPNLLHHVIVRGIERRDIFFDDDDRRSFLTRFATLLQETGTECLAWALMKNHFHLLLCPRQEKLATFMRRLLTGYAVTYNRRHKRSGHFFQNRYKSIVCEEETYLLELVRYIHLNPLRAGAVKDMDELDRYPWCGHAVLMGNVDFSAQDTEEVLSRFGRGRQSARARYRAFVADGIPLGKRDELVGGGKRRSLKLADLVEDDGVFDARVLGDTHFVERLRREFGMSERLPQKITLAELAKRVADLFSIKPQSLRQHTRSVQVTDARAVFCNVAVREMGYSGAEVARLLKLSRAGVTVAARRGGVMVQEDRALRKETARLTN